MNNQSFKAHRVNPIHFDDIALIVCRTTYTDCDQTKKPTGRNLSLTWHWFVRTEQKNLLEYFFNEAIYNASGETFNEPLF